MVCAVRWVLLADLFKSQDSGGDEAAAAVVAVIVVGGVVVVGTLVG